MKYRYLGLTCAALILLGAAFSFAQQTEQTPPEKPGEKAAEKPKEEKKTPAPPEDKVVQTKHSAKIGGQEIKYTATAGTILLKLEDGTPKASVFYIAYTRDDVSDSAKRPVTFTFNGGPGSASIWLHLGAFGPRRVKMGDAGALLPPPYELVDNEYSLLDLTDLVFIDPVSTGYSRAVPGETPNQFHGIQQDVESVGDFIRLYATRNKRWTSPKFLAGESYGTTRSAQLASTLQSRTRFRMSTGSAPKRPICTILSRARRIHASRPADAFRGRVPSDWGCRRRAACLILRKTRSPRRRRRGCAPGLELTIAGHLVTG